MAHQTWMGPVRPPLGLALPLSGSPVCVYSPPPRFQVSWGTSHTLTSCLCFLLHTHTHTHTHARKMEVSSPKFTKKTAHSTFKILSLFFFMRSLSPWPWIICSSHGFSFFFFFFWIFSELVIISYFTSFPALYFVITKSFTKLTLSTL